MLLLSHKLDNYQMIEWIRADSWPSACVWNGGNLAIVDLFTISCRSGMFGSNRCRTPHDRVNLRLCDCVQIHRAILNWNNSYCKWFEYIMFSLKMLDRVSFGAGANSFSVSFDFFLFSFALNCAALLCNGQLVSWLQSQYKVYEIPNITLKIYESFSLRWMWIH